MKSYSYGMEIKPDGIQYGNLEFTFFEAREVLKKNSPTGEYHIKIKDSSNLLNAIDYFKKQFPGCEVGLIDPDGILNLEFQIFILIKDRIILSNVTDIFNEIDKELTKKED